MSVSANSLDLVAIDEVLRDCAIGHTVAHYPQVASTMPLAHEWAAKNTTRSGSLIITDEQTAGRGRVQRRWMTPPGEALLISLILKPPLTVPPHQLFMAAGVGAVRALTMIEPTLQGQVGLKWPNDLLLGHSMHDAGKAGGILVENRYHGSSISHAVVGMGVNLLQDASTLAQIPHGAVPATSMAHYLSQTERGALISQLDRSALLIALCQAWAALLALPTVTATTTIYQEWRAALWTLGQEIVLHDSRLLGPGNGDEPSIVAEGKAIDVTAFGQLVVIDSRGVRHTFDAGDVSVRMGSQE